MLTAVIHIPLPEYGCVFVCSPDFVAPKIKVFVSAFPFAITSILAIARPAQTQVVPLGQRDSSTTSINFKETSLRVTLSPKDKLMESSSIFCSVDWTWVTDFWPQL